MLKFIRNFYHPFKFSTLILNFSEVWPRQILDLGKQFNLMTPWKRLEDVLKTYGQDEYIGLDQDVLKMSCRRVLKTKRKDAFKTSSSRRVFEEVFAIHLEDILKTYWRRLEDVCPRQIYWSWSRCLEDVF